MFVCFQLTYDNAWFVVFAQFDHPKKREKKFKRKWSDLRREIKTSVSSISQWKSKSLVPQFIFSSCSGFLLFWSRDKEFKNFLE